MSFIMGTGAKEMPEGGIRMIRRTLALLIAALLIGLQGAQAEVLDRLVPDAELVGEARFKVMFFKIYDAQLYAPNGRYSAGNPYSLRLHYLINAKKGRIVSSTVKEMRRMKAASNAQIESWVPVMDSAFIDMPKGSHADFIHTSDGRLTLVADGEIITTPLGTATLDAIAPVTPEQSAPIIAATPCDINPSAAAVAAAESTQVESASKTDIFFPPNKDPDAEASSKANLAESLIAGVRDSIGPVNPKIIPILIACPSAITFVPKLETSINAAINSFFIIFLFYC